VKVSNVLHETIGAIDGVRLHINEKGEVAELYLFESDSADFEEMKEADFTLVNGNVILGYHKDHEDVEEIEEVFSSY